MKKRNPLSVLAAAALALSVAAHGCGKEKSPSPQEPPKREAAEKERKVVPKAGPKWFSGTIEALDESGGTLTVKGPKEEMEFRADRRAKKDLEGLKIGDKVMVKHTGETAHSIVKPGAGSNTRSGPR